MTSASSNDDGTVLVDIDRFTIRVIALANDSIFLAPAVTVGERRELWILPPFFFGLFFCL